MGRVSRALQRQAAAKATAEKASTAVVPPATASPGGNVGTITTDPTQSTTQLALRLGFALCMQHRRQQCGSDNHTGMNVEGMDRVLAKAERRIQGLTPVQRDALWNKIEADFMTEHDDSNLGL
jgi:hypothetical protein